MPSVLFVGPADGAGSLLMQVLAAGHDLYAAPDAGRALAAAALTRPGVVLYDLAASPLGPGSFAARLREVPGCEWALLVALAPGGRGATCGRRPPRGSTST
jgi:hypothetical protein